MGQQLVLTGLGNEMNLTTGKMVFTAVFNKDVRIEISKEAAEVLTTAIYSAAQEAPKKKKQLFTEEEIEEGDREEERLAGAPILQDTDSSIYDNDTGVEQV
jgi:hypothetical protein